MDDGAETQLARRPTSTRSTMRRFDAAATGCGNAISGSPTQTVRPPPRCVLIRGKRNSPLWELPQIARASPSATRQYRTIDRKVIAMARFTKLPTQALAIWLFVFVGMTAANPIAHLVDCSDSFWAIACAAEIEDVGEDEGDSGDLGGAEAQSDIVLGEPVRIDNDHVCAEIEGGFIVCHT